MITRKVEVVETLSIDTLLPKKDLVIYMSNITMYKMNYTFSCSECRRNFTVEGYFIFFKRPLPFIKNNSRIMLMNVTIVYSKWPLEKRISDSIGIGFLASKPLMIIPITTSGKTSYLVAHIAYTWLGMAEGFNDIKPRSKIFTFNLDSSTLRTGGKSKGRYPKNTNALALAIIPSYPPEKIKYIDLRHAYIAYVKG